MSCPTTSSEQDVCPTLSFSEFRNHILKTLAAIPEEHRRRPTKWYQRNYADKKICLHIYQPFFDRNGEKKELVYKLVFQTTKKPQKFILDIFYIEDDRTRNRAAILNELVVFAGNSVTHACNNSSSFPQTFYLQNDLNSSSSEVAETARGNQEDRSLHEPVLTVAQSSTSSNLAEVSEVDAERRRQKDALSDLNVRLANYIKTIHRLEAENKIYRLQECEVEHREKETQLQRRIDDLRAQIEALNRDCSQAVVERETAVHNFEDLNFRFNLLEKDLETANCEHNACLGRIKDLNARLKENEAQNLEIDKLNTVIGERDERIAALSKQIEDKTVLCSTVESRFKNLKDELAFTRRSHENEILEINKKRQAEIERAVADTNALANSLARQLETLRHEFQSRVGAVVDELKTKNKKEVDRHCQNLVDASNEAHRIRAEFAMFRSQTAAKEKLNQDLQKQVDNLLTSVAELEFRVQVLHQDYGDRLRRKDMRLAELETLSTDHQNLLIEKKILDDELAAYKQLLDSEDARLRTLPNLSLNSSRQGNSRRGTKRRSVESDLSFSKLITSETGYIGVTDIDADEQAVTLTNHGGEDIVIGGWMLNVTADGHKVTFNFDSHQVIKAGTTISVFSHTVTPAYWPPNHLFMKDKNWQFGKVIRAEVQNDKAEVVAYRTLTFHNKSSNQDSTVDQGFIMNMISS